MWLLLGMRTYQTQKNIENGCHCNEDKKAAPNNHKEGLTCMVFHNHKGGSIHGLYLRFIFWFGIILHRVWRSEVNPSTILEVEAPSIEENVAILIFHPSPIGDITL